MTQSGSTSFSLPKELAYDSPDKLVLDTIVAPGEPIRTFAADEAICLWRLRNKKSTSKKNGTKLYPGCAIYLYEQAQRDAFVRWNKGETSSMAESKTSTPESK